MIHALISKEIDIKLNTTSKKCHSFGYASAAKRHKLYHRESCKCFVIRDVYFN